MKNNDNDINIKKIQEELKNIKTNLLSEINLSNFYGKNILTFGTFDIFHVGHEKIIDHCIEIALSEKNVWVGVSSDYWNERKNKNAFENEKIRTENISRKYKDINVFLENHDFPEESWPVIWDKYKIDLIIMGGDHFENLNYINNLVTPNNNKMKIAFYERTPKISSTLIKSSINEK